MARAADAENLRKHTLAVTLGTVFGVSAAVGSAALAVFVLLRRRRPRAATDIEVVCAPAGDPPDPFLAVPPNPPEAEPGEFHRELLQ